jgi:hypothetical protein
MLQVFYLNVAKVYRGMLHVLQWIHTYVAKRLFEVFQLFQMDVATILFGCCKVDPDVPCITMASHVCCKFMFQMFYLFSNACCNCFSVDVAKLSSESYKSTSTFFTCAYKTERAEPRARLKRSWRDNPTGPARVQRSKGGADLPRVRANGGEQGAAFKQAVPSLRYASRLHLPSLGNDHLQSAPSPQAAAAKSPSFRCASMSNTRFCCFSVLPPDSPCEHVAPPSVKPSILDCS